MKNVRFLLPVVAAVVLAGGVSAYFLTRRPTTVVTASQVVSRMNAATAKLTSSLGPNTTFHQVSLRHIANPTAMNLPADTKTEWWMAFGADGNLSASYARTTDPTGSKVYQIEVFTPPNIATITDLKEGTTDRFPFGGNATYFAAHLSALLSAVQTAVASTPAPTGVDAAGVTAYILTTATNRSYIDTSSYLLLQSDTLAADGSVTESTQYPVYLEVLSGNAVPVVTPIAGLTTVPGIDALATKPASTATATPTPPQPHDIVLPAYPSSGSTLDANGKVEVPVSVGGPANVPLNAGGFQIHLRWDASVFTFSSATSTGTIIPSPLCPAAIVDADGAGVVFGCVATGGAVATAGAGLLGTVILTPAASGCSALHLFTYGPPDGGNSATGTYTLAPDGSVQVNTYSPIDPRVNVLGVSC